MSTFQNQVRPRMMRMQIRATETDFQILVNLNVTRNKQPFIH